MPKKNKKDAKQVKGEVLYTDPEQIRAQLEFKKEMGQAVYDEIGTAYEEVKDDYRDMALADLKDKGVDITKGRVDQQVDQWRADNIKPREALAIMWKRLGFMFTDDELEEQLFMFKRPKATFPKNANAVVWEPMKLFGLVDFLNIYKQVMRDKKQQIDSLASAFRGVGDGKSNGITPDQLKFALTELQGKFKGNPMSEEQIEEFLKVANVRKNTEQYAPLIECLEISTKIVNTISGDGGSKKKKKKGKKKK